MEAPGTSRCEDDIEGSVGGPYMVEKIVGIYMGKNHKKYFRVKWIDSWEPEENLSEGCQVLIDEFWSGKTLDCQGKEIKQTELRSGQKIIKKEINTSQSNELTAETQSNLAETPQSSVNISSDSRSAIPKLKSELLSPHDNEPISEEVSQSSSLKKDKTSNIKTRSALANNNSNEEDTAKQNVEHNPSPPNLRRNPHRDASSSPITGNSGCLQTRSAAKKQSANIMKSLEKNDICISDKSIESENKKRKSVDGQTQTDEDILENVTKHTSTVHCVRSQVVTEILKSPHQRRQSSIETQTSSSHHATNEPQQITTATVSSTQSPMLEERSYDGMQHGVSTNGVISTSEIISGDELEAVEIPPLSENEPEDIVDIESGDEDVEITVSIQCPNKRLKYTDVRSSRLSRSAPTNMRRQGREKTTQRRRNHPGRGERRGSDNSPSRLLHPRSLLPSYPPESNKNGNHEEILRPTNSQSSVAIAPTRKRLLENIQQIDEEDLPNHQASVPLNQRPSQITNSPSSFNKNSTGHTTSNLSSPGRNHIDNCKEKNIIDRTCNICDHTFSNLTRARQHMREAHSDEQQQQHKQANLNSNISLNGHSSTSSTTSSRHFSDLTCHICFGVFRNNRDLKSHLLLHSDQKNLQKCEICLRTFRSKSTLNQHLLLHTDELPYHCETCGKRFRQQGHLIVHMGKHSQNNEGSFFCPHCNQEFVSNISFRNHVRTHEAELPFSCTQCQDRFESKLDLMKHLEGHNEGKPFTCHICKKSFKTKTYLSGHMQMHKSSSPRQSNMQPQKNNHVQASSRSANPESSLHIIKPQKN